jgi:hypothetical protein
VGAGREWHWAAPDVEVPGTRDAPESAHLPPDAELLDMVEDLLTFEQIHDECHRRTGVRVARTTLSAALSRAALTKVASYRYQDTVPWLVRPEHASHGLVRMLRLLGRRRTGFPISLHDIERLDEWLHHLAMSRLVVAYCPELDDGFVEVHDSWRRGPNPDIPICARVLTLDEARRLG